jgi:hypothetical protein
MAAVAHNPAFAKKAGVPQSVGQDFAAADKGKKFGTGTRADLQGVNKPKTNQGKNELFNKGGSMKESKAMVGKEMAFMKKKGAPASMMKHEMGEMTGMKKGGMKKMASGGIAASKMGTVKTKPGNINGVAAKGLTKGKVVSMAGNRGMKKGGKAC